MTARPLLWSLLFAATFSTAALGWGEDDPFGDLFGDSLNSEGSSIDKLRDTTKDIKVKSKNDALAPKSAETGGDGKIELVKAFAASRIRVHPKRGCEPTDRRKTKLRQLTFNELPIKGPAYAVCLRLNSAVGREVRLTTAIVDARNRKIARAESVVSFRGKRSVDHVMEFPAATYRLEGQYEYLVEVEGEEAGRLPLLVVKVSDD